MGVFWSDTVEGESLPSNIFTFSRRDANRTSLGERLSVEYSFVRLGNFNEDFNFFIPGVQEPALGLAVPDITMAGTGGGKKVSSGLGSISLPSVLMVLISGPALVIDSDNDFDSGHRRGAVSIPQNRKSVADFDNL